MNKLYILAPTYERARYWAHEHGLRKDEFVSVCDPHPVRGVDGKGLNYVDLLGNKTPIDEEHIKTERELIFRGFTEIKESRFMLYRKLTAVAKDRARLIPYLMELRLKGYTVKFDLGDRLKGDMHGLTGTVFVQNNTESAKAEIPLEWMEF